METKTIKLYDANGQIIQIWYTTDHISFTGSVASFIDNNGRKIIISGTFVIESKS